MILHKIEKFDGHKIHARGFVTLTACWAPSGGQSWEPSEVALKDMMKDVPQMVHQYASENGLLEQKGWRKVKAWGTKNLAAAQESPVAGSATNKHISHINGNGAGPGGGESPQRQQLTKSLKGVCFVSVLFLFLCHVWGRRRD